MENPRLEFAEYLRVAALTPADAKRFLDRTDEPVDLGPDPRSQTGVRIFGFRPENTLMEFLVELVASLPPEERRLAFARPEWLELDKLERSRFIAALEQRLPAGELP